MDKLSRELQRLSLMHYQKQEQTTVQLINSLHQSDKLLQSLIVSEVEEAMKRDLNQVITKKESIRLYKDLQALAIKHPDLKEWVEQAQFPLYYQSKDALQYALTTHLTDYTLTNQKRLEEALIKSYQTNYLLVAYQIQEGQRQYQSLSNPFHVAQIIKQPWVGHENFISRFSKNKERTIKELTHIFTTGMEKGWTVEEMKKQCQKRLAMTSNQAKRLIHTESSHIFAQATADAYSYHQVEEYEILATLDDRTSSICQELDGQRFKLSEKQVGVNYPPFHPLCRTTTIPVVERERVGTDKRKARDSEGNPIVVDYMTYREWQREYLI